MPSWWLCEDSSGPQLGGHRFAARRPAGAYCILLPDVAPRRTQRGWHLVGLLPLLASLPFEGQILSVVERSVHRKLVALAPCV